MISPTLMRGAMIAVGAAMAWSLVVMVDALALSPMGREEQRAAELRSELAALRQRVAEAEAALTHRTRSAESRPPMRLSMRSPNIETTAVAMQENARNAVARSGGMPISSQAAVEPSQGTVKVLVRARFNEPGLLSFLRAMETSDPPMLVESFELSKLPGVAEAPLEFTGTFLGFHTDAL